MINWAYSCWLLMLRTLDESDLIWTKNDIRCTGDGGAKENSQENGQGKCWFHNRLTNKNIHQ